ncbi:MAG: PD-(D/E)XK nuclease family protein, partial [Saprospiraceae bacterium]|nr:PD-(D/E)XK nuclease family protein [Saprospiraceae bacterium]
MILELSLSFDKLTQAPGQASRAAHLYAGPKKLLAWLESRFGLGGYPENTDYLRIELYRQALSQWLETAPQPPFFAASFEADRFATAAVLLTRRDELRLAGWSFEASGQVPTRLADLAAVERFFLQKIQNPEAGATAWGEADRWALVFEQLGLRTSGIQQVVLHEPETLLPVLLRRVLQQLRRHGVPVGAATASAGASPASDLGHVQQRLKNPGLEKKQAANDGSLLILRARRDSDAAVFMAQWLAQNPGWQPVFLLPELSRVLEQALLLEGFPAMGVLSASLARPSLQVLKLAPAFLWEPVDVFKIMEFVTLPVKPLDDGLALEIARVMAEKPGLFSDTWFAAVLGYLERGELPARVREQYEFWFGRRRYRSDSPAPKRDAIELYDYLFQWARTVVEETKNTSFLVLAEQARRVRDLLQTLPETRLSFLELERIVRTIYEPAPVQLQPAETGRFEYLHQAGALVQPVDTLVWWNCLFDSTVPSPDVWPQAEREWLATQHIELDDPFQQGQRRLLQNQRPVLNTRERLILVVPEQADGAEAQPSLLLSDIEAAFGDCRGLMFNLDQETDRQALLRLGAIPQREWLTSRPSSRAVPQLRISAPEHLEPSEYETPTNLESLFYYPHRWFFRQKLRLFPASLLRVTRDHTLLGSLAHRFFELLLKEDNCLEWDKPTVHDWIDQRALGLLEREGATLMLYGREPERNQFLHRVKHAAWSLLSLLRQDGWAVWATEFPLEGNFAGLPVRGKADLVLRRGESEWAIVDLKWSGARRRREMIRNGEDL